jgi:hypothetical protein
VTSRLLEGLCGIFAQRIVLASIATLRELLLHIAPRRLTVTEDSELSSAGFWLPQDKSNRQQTKSTVRYRGDSLA